MQDERVAQLVHLHVTFPSSLEMTITTVFSTKYPNKGGLGGEFVISTSSKTSGTLVIRHELGHNLIPVGEEYDGGWVYRGVNSAHSLPADWSHWLTNTSAAETEERNRVVLQEYPWLDLANGPWRKMFYTTGHQGGWERVYIQGSASGVPKRDDLWVGIDGSELDWYPTGNDDRRFLEWHADKGFAPGFHVIEFRQKTEPKKGQMPRQLCSIEIIEYGPEEEYHLKKVTGLDDVNVGIRCELSDVRHQRDENVATYR
jgi:hypothetical protein